MLKKLLDNGLMPVVSPLSADESGTLLNINADTVAAALGAALGAEKLILCTGAPGILGDVNDPGSLISYTDLHGLKRLREEGRIADGMLPKAKAIEDALRGGVRRVHVVSYQSPEGILGEVFTNEGTGTLIVADVQRALARRAAGRRMKRLWDKGAPLDERVLRYTAGEDYALDERLVPYDVRASLAHARDAARAAAAVAAPIWPPSAQVSRRSPMSTRAAPGTSSSPMRTARPRSSGG